MGSERQIRSTSVIEAPNAHQSQISIGGALCVHSPRFPMAFAPFRSLKPDIALVQICNLGRNLILSVAASAERQRNFPPHCVCK
jgi:hypothetical protein